MKDLMQGKADQSRNKNWEDYTAFNTKVVC